MDNHYEARETLYEKGMQRLEQAQLVVQSAYRTENYLAAAEEFEGAGDYMNAAEKAEECRLLAQQSEADGVEERYRKAVQAQQKIMDRSDADKLVDEFHALGDYKDSKERRGECVKKAEHFIRRARIKRITVTVILIALIIACAFLARAGMWGYVKGLLYGASGNYSAAVENFQELGHFLDSSKKAEIDREKQLRAREKKERTTLDTLEAGDQTPYGEYNWTVLGILDGELLLVPDKISREGDFWHVPYDTQGGTDWESSSLRSYLNEKILPEMFTDEERSRISGDIVLPDEEMLEKYGKELASLGTDIWVAIPGAEEGTQSYLTGGGTLMRYGCPADNEEISVCPVMRVKLVNIEE